MGLAGCNQSHAWGDGDAGATSRANQALLPSLHFERRIPQISHMLSGFLERCEARIAPATLAAILLHPAGVPLTLSAGCPIWAILIPIGACRGRGRGRRRTWSWLRTCGTPLTITSPFAIAPALTAPSPLTISSTASMAAEPRAWRRLGGRRCWCHGRRGLRQVRTNRSNESVLEGDPSVRMILPQISGCALRTTGTIT